MRILLTACNLETLVYWDLRRGWFQRGWLKKTFYCKLCLCYNNADCHVVLSEIWYLKTTPL